MVTVSPHVGGLAPTIGRTRELHDLRLAFQISTLQVLCGMGGVGKTSLARAYAQQHLSSYSLLWWIRAEDPASIDAEFRSLLEVLLPPGEATQIADARTKAFDLLAHHPGPWLLVLDNVPNAASCNGLLPPIGNGHTLITSRAVDWPASSTVQPLATEAAVELLITQSGDRDTDAAKTLADELGGLPLALTQAAGFVRTNAINLAAYLKLYQDRGAELHQDGRPPDYPHTVATTWDLAIDRLSDDGRAMLNVLAFYAPEAIPVHILFPAADELTRHRAVGELRSYSLVTPAELDSVTVHRLIQAVTRKRLQTQLTAHVWASKARELIMAAMPSDPVTAVSVTRWNALHTHVRALIDHLPPEHPDTLAIRHELAYWTGQVGQTTEARELSAELLPIQQRILGAEHPRTLSNRHNLAHWTGQAGDAVRAQQLLADLLPLRERVEGIEHQNTLITRLALAHWTGLAGDAAHARQLFAELLPIRERILGAEHPGTLITRGNLADWTGYSGNPTLARNLFAALLPIWERVGGPEYPHTLTTRHTLAHWTGQAGDTSQARDQLAELLPIRERVLGAEHPSTLLTRQSLAYWTALAGDAAKARDQLAELVPIMRRVLGANHHRTLTAASELEAWTDLAEAEELGPSRSAARLAEGGGEDSGAEAGVEVAEEGAVGADFEDAQPGSGGEGGAEVGGG